MSEENIGRLRWLIFLAGGAAALTVLFEAAHGGAVFLDPQYYEWEGSTTRIFRAGGVFGGSPSAGILLSVVLLSSVALYRERRRITVAVGAVIVAAITVTFARSAFVGLSLGAVVIAILLPYRQWGRVIMTVLALSIPAYAVATSSSVASITHNRLITAGITRNTGRSTLLGEALPLIADTPSHLLFGRGFDAFQATAGVHDSEMAATPTIWTVNGGPNDDYMRAVLEQGLLGLVALVAWVGGAILLGVRTSLRLPKRSDRRLIVAGLTAGTLCYAVALAGHDLTHNRLDLSFIALFAGILVSVCTNYQHISADDQEVAIADSEDQ